MNMKGPRTGGVLSVTEGEDKPLKYLLAFQVASLVVISKTDLVPHHEFDMDALHEDVHEAGPGVEWQEVTAGMGEGVDGWIDWLWQEPSGSS